MPPLLYLTTNEHKMNEANTFLAQKHGIALEMMNPAFSVPEIQAKTCAEVAAFSAKYAAEKLKRAVLKSDTGLYLESLGGLPGPYNAYFDKQIGIELFLEMIQNCANRKARLEHCFAYCEPNQEPKVFSGGSSGTIAFKARGTCGRWHDRFYIPDGETCTLSELRAIDYAYEAQFWGHALDDFAVWYKSHKK